jgi:hypothetical protein
MSRVWRQVSLRIDRQRDMLMGDEPPMRQTVSGAAS